MAESGKRSRPSGAKPEGGNLQGANLYGTFLREADGPACAGKVSYTAEINAPAEVEIQAGD